MRFSALSRRGLAAASLTIVALGAAPAVYATAASGPLRVDVSVQTRADKCFDVRAGSTVNGAAVIQYTCKESSNQRFTLQGAGDGSWQLRTHADKCLDVRGSSTADETPVIQYTCTGNANQRFRIVSVPGGLVEIRTFAGKCLDVRGGDSSNLVPIIQYTCKASSNQRFTLEQL
ncbi:RICIN domain-containing protein [Nonomuraea pusilla]|uniref:RICIN domain-containing protein n=1 Tax=Nonomuraea pusilla TaxID=46177 RepID=UPI003332A8C7